MKVLTNLDLNKNEIQNVRLQQLSADPSSSNLVAGMVWMNTSSTPYVVKYYNGTEIITLGKLDFEATASNIKMNGTASVGSLSTVARADHIHPSDTSRVPTTRTVNGKALSSDINIYAADIKYDDAQGAETLNDLWFYISENVVPLVEQIGDAAFKGVDDSISSGSTSTNLPTSAAVADLVSSAVGAADAMRFKGTIGTGGTVTSLPTSGVNVGDTYRVITAGTYASQQCEVGDLIIATATTPTWTVAQTNIDGAITGISSGTGISVTGSGASRTVALSSGVATAGSKGDTSDQTPSWGDTFKVTSETIDTYGRTTALSEHTVTIPDAVASTSSAGLMSASDKTVLTNLYYLQNCSYVEATNSALTPSGGVCTWSTGAYSSNTDLLGADLYEVSTGSKVLADIAFVQNGQSYTIRVKINSTSTIAAGTYKLTAIVHHDAS